MKRRPVKPIRIAEVAWNDHHFSSSSYKPSEVMRKMAKPWLRVTIGYLAGEDKDCILVASTYDEKDGKFTEVNCILKPTVVWRRNL